MGNRQSTQVVLERPPEPPIEDAVRRWTDEQATFGLSREKLASVRGAFNASVYTTPNASKEQGFAAFLGRYQRGPKLDLVDAAPILYRLALYFGAFPFPPSSQELTVDMFLRARIFINSRGVRHIATQLGTLRTEGFDLDGRETQRRLLFQALAESADLLSPPKEKVGVPIDPSKRFVSNANDGDGHLQDIVDIIECIFVQRSADPAFQVPLPGESRVLAEPLPRSQRCLAESEVSSKDIYILLKLMLSISQLNQVAVERVLKGVFAVFSGSQDRSVSWRTFNKIMTKSMPNLFVGLARIFDNPVSGQSFTRFGGVVDSSRILSGPVINQLSFFLPEKWSNSILRPVYAGSSPSINFNHFRRAVLDCNEHTLLLVSGHPTSSRTPSSNAAALEKKQKKTQSVIYGACITSRWQEGFSRYFGGEQDILFQLSPVHNVFHAAKRNVQYGWLAYDPFNLDAGGVGFGSECPSLSNPTKSMPGPTSLTLRENLSRGLFVHDAKKDWRLETYDSGAGRPSKLTYRTNFVIDRIEVWTM